MTSRSLSSFAILVLSGFSLSCLNSGNAAAHVSRIESIVEGRADVLGLQGDDQSGYPSLSADGRYVAFESFASNLVPNDRHIRTDIFLRDRVAGTTRLVSAGLGGSPANAESHSPAISADGRYVAFSSYASNLVVGDTNSFEDVFVFDTTDGSITLVSRRSGGPSADNASYSPALSADGEVVTFVSHATNLLPIDTNGGFPDVLVRRWKTGDFTVASVSGAGQQGNGSSTRPALSADGNVVAFQSTASNLVAGAGGGQIYVRDLGLATTQLISASSSGQPGEFESLGPTISGDGVYVAFDSESRNLVAGDSNEMRDVFVRNRVAGTTIRASRNLAGAQSLYDSEMAAFSSDGSKVAYSQRQDAFGVDYQILVFDRLAQTTTSASVSDGGQAANRSANFPALSSNGRHVAFVTDADNLGVDTNRQRDVFVRDRQLQQTRVISQADASGPFSAAPMDSSGFGGCRTPISGNGRYIAFGSVAWNLLPGDTTDADVFVRDSSMGTLRLAATNAQGVSSSFDSRRGCMSRDGRFVSFESWATDLVPGLNDRQHVFVKNLVSGAIETVSRPSSGLQPNGNAEGGVLSADARYVAFLSASSNLVAGDDNGYVDVFLRDRQSGTTSRVSSAHSGLAANGASSDVMMSGDGRWIVFTSSASNLVPGDTNLFDDVFRYDRITGSTTMISVRPDGFPSNGNSSRASVSDDGNLVFFSSYAADIGGDWGSSGSRMFVRDVMAGVTTRLGRRPDNQYSSGQFLGAAIFPDGKHVLYMSNADDLVAGDTNNNIDVFVLRLSTGQSERVSVDKYGTQGSSPSTDASVSADGRSIALGSLVPNWYIDKGKAAFYATLFVATYEELFANSFE